MLLKFRGSSKKLGVDDPKASSWMNSRRLLSLLTSGFSGGRDSLEINTLNRGIELLSQPLDNLRSPESQLFFALI